MDGFKLISDSSCDLPSHMLKQHDISLVNYYVSLDGVKYQREYDEISPQYFYKRVRADSPYPKTSMPPTQDYIDVFRPALLAGKDILCVCMTSKFSGSYASSMTAWGLLKDEFPGRKMISVDSEQCTMPQGVLVSEAAKLRDAGRTLEETAAALEAVKQKYVTYITVDSLDALQRGGRIGKVSGFLGTLLNIKPVIKLHDGELFPVTKIRGRKKAIAEVIDFVCKEMGGEAGKYHVGVLHSDCLEEVPYVRDILENEKGVKVDLPVFTIGTTIGTHIGPTVVGVGCYPKITEL
ncbi:MAG: DegV family protein [Defluviitaleaceae bacterium]|nr:DegV family protein [Defluviitaleaceae bacterium]